MSETFDEKISDFDFPDLNAVETTREHELRRPIRAKLIQTQKQTFYLLEHFGLTALLNVEDFNTIFKPVDPDTKEQK